MYNLILKDFLIQKKYLMVTVIYGFLVFFMFPNFHEFIYTIGSLAITYTSIVNAISKDDRNRGEVLFISLPVPRIKIVQAKYLSLFTFLFWSLLITGMSGAIIKLIGLPISIRYINFTDITMAYLSVGLLSSIYFPLYFKHGNRIINFIGMFLFLFTFFLPGMVIENKENPLINKFISAILETPIWLINITSFLAITLIILFSLFLSIRIFNKKEY